MEKVEFLVIGAARIRIFGGGGQRRAGQLHAAVIIRHLQAGQHPETLRIALITPEIGAFVLGHGLLQRGGDGGMGEPVTDRLFAGMTERRIADVMAERGGGADGADIARLQRRQIAVAADEDAGPGAERPADRSGFQAVGQTGADVIVLGQRKYLGFVLQAAERGGEDDPVEVLLERRPAGLQRFRLIFAEPLER